MIISFLELFRRSIWNFLRLEKSHVDNCASFKQMENFEMPFDIQDLEKEIQYEQEEHLFED